MAGLKPQDFNGLAGKDIPVKNLADKIIEAIKKRKDLSSNLSNYLTLLTEYCADPSSVSTKDLSKYYGKLDMREKAAINKDFSELLGALVLKNDQSKLKKLNLTMNNQSKLFIPTAGNYPLVDFLIKTQDVVDEYSVKIMGKTTNTVKAQDVLSVASNKLKNRNPKETKILQIIADNDAKIGPIMVLAELAPDISQLKKTNKMYRKFVSLAEAKKINNDVLSENPEEWWDFFEPLMDQYYSNGKATLAKTWKKKFYYDVLTVLAQYTVADFTKDMNWGEFVDEVQSKVTYFKFALESNGTFSHEVINGLSERKPNQKFRLRAKSRIKESAPSSRSGQDKLGIQP